MASTTISFEKENVEPPVFIAGSFTDWKPTEMASQTRVSEGSAQHVFTYNAVIQPGHYQYKFRLGPGDWWVLDDSAPTGMIGRKMRRDKVC